MDYRIIWDGSLAFFMTADYRIDYIIDFKDDKIYKNTGYENRQ